MGDLGIEGFRELGIGGIRDWGICEIGVICGLKSLKHVRFVYNLRTVRIKSLEHEKFFNNLR